MANNNFSIIFFVLIIIIPEKNMAQNCSGDHNLGQPVSCQYNETSTQDIDLNINDADIVTSAEDQNHSGINTVHEGEGNNRVVIKNVDITVTGDQSNGVSGIHSGEGHVEIEFSDGEIQTKPSNSDFSTNIPHAAIYGLHDGIGTVKITVSDAEISTMGQHNRGIHGVIGYNLERDTNQKERVLSREFSSDITIKAKNVNIKTEGEFGFGIGAWHSTSDDRSHGNIYINVQGGTITTLGDRTWGMSATHDGNGNIKIDASNFKIQTSGSQLSHGIFVNHRGATRTGGIHIIGKKLDLKTTGNTSRGILAWNRKKIGKIVIELENSKISTQGNSSEGVAALSQGNSEGDINVSVIGSKITTNGANSYGISGLRRGGTGDISIVSRNNHITTSGTNSFGILGFNSGKGDIEITSEDTIVTEGRSAIGIYARYDGISQDQGIMIHAGGDIKVLGKGSNGVRIGVLNNNLVYRGSTFDDNGYRRQTINLTGSISSDGAGIYLAGGGRVFIGSQGFIKSNEGIAILATGDTSGNNPGDPVISPRLYLDINLNGRSIDDVIGDDWILNDGGGTTIVINGVKLHDSTSGVIPGIYAANGIWNVKIRPEGVLVDHENDPWIISEPTLGIISDRDFSTADFIYTYSPRGALYEVVPNFLLGLNKPVSTGIKMFSSGSNIWTNFSRDNLSHQPMFSTLDAEFSAQLNGFEIGMDFRIGENLIGSTSIRRNEGSADVTARLTEGGKILTEGYGLAFGLSYPNIADGWYARSGLFLAKYKLTFHSESLGLLADGIGSKGLSFDFEVGRNIKLNNRIMLVPRLGTMMTSIHLSDFTDNVGTRVKMPNTFYRASSVGLVAKMKIPVHRTGGELSLQAAIDYLKGHTGEVTRINVSGEDLVSVSRSERLVFALGANWQREKFFMESKVIASASNSENIRYSVLMTFGMEF